MFFLILDLFQCSNQDGVHSIGENVCEYNVKFKTPAACWLSLFFFVIKNSNSAVIHRDNPFDNVLHFIENFVNINPKLTKQPGIRILYWWMVVVVVVVVRDLYVLLYFIYIFIFKWPMGVWNLIVYISKNLVVLFIYIYFIFNFPPKYFYNFII